MAKAAEVLWVAKARWGGTWYAFDGVIWHAESSDDIHDDFAGIMTEFSRSIREEYQPAFGEPGPWVARSLFEMVPPNDQRFREQAGEQPIAGVN